MSNRTCPVCQKKHIKKIHKGDLITLRWMKEPKNNVIVEGLVDVTQFQSIPAGTPAVFIDKRRDEGNQYVVMVDNFVGWVYRDEICEIGV